MSNLRERLDNGEVIIMDGAIGTEIQRMGVPMNHECWCAEAIKTHPEVVRQLHEDYLKAGAEIVTVNTFSASRISLESAGMGDLTRELNTQAVQLAKEARDKAGAGRPVYIAGPLSGFAGGFVGESYTEQQIRANYQEHAEILAEAGVDLMLMEFLINSIEPIAYATEAAVDTGLPTWVAMSARIRDDGTVILGFGGRPENTGTKPGPEIEFGDAIDAVMGIGGSALLVIHSEVEDVAQVLKVCREHWDGPIGAYAHSGHWIRPNWQFVNMISPHRYLAEARKWVDERGAQIIGGCCGIGVQHVELLRPGLPSRISRN